MEQLLEVLKGNILWVAVSAALAILCYLACVKRSVYLLHMLQLEGYDNEEFTTWISNNKEKVHRLRYLEGEGKTPLVWTDRAKRLFALHKQQNALRIVLIFAFSIGLTLLLKNGIVSVIVSALLLALHFFFQYKVLLASNSLSVPREEKINQGFYVQAQGKVKELKEKNGLKVLGITGSFGKTSVKFISDTILSESLQVKNTPSSYNTPMGLSKVINNELNGTHEVFIAELGAKKKGEIDEVAQLVQPDIGIITAIGPTHMHLFHTIENIMNTKYELIEDLPQDGVAIFNYDNEYVKVLADKTTKKTLRYGMEDTQHLDVYADDISVGEFGSRFRLNYQNQQVYCETKLLGKHNISNILAACTAAIVLGMDLESIARGVEKIEPVEHRLNIVDGGTGVIVIDDAFNSNPVGFRAALDVLGAFTTGQKIIITPGMVELGEMEEEENYKIGKEIANVCDYVILVGKKRTEPIARGLRDENYSEERLIVVNTLQQATEQLAHLTRPGDVVLFENDLPDSYSE